MVRGGKKSGKVIGWYVYIYEDNDGEERINLMVLWMKVLM